MKKIILVTFIFIFFLYNAAYAIEKIDMSIQTVIIQPREETIIYTNNWSNDKFSLQLRLTWIGVHLRLTNNTDQPMLLLWNKSAMVDVDGNSHRLIPGETRTLFSALSIPETMIPPHTSYALMAVADGYFFDSMSDYKLILDYPIEKDFLGNITNISSKKSKKYKTFAQKYAGRTLSMILCLNINGQDEYYNFNMALDFYKSIDAPDFGANTTKTQIPISLGWVLDGAVIKYINPGELAEKAGLRVNDIILEINGRPFSEVDSPQRFIEKRFSDGRSVMLLISRDGEQKIVTLKKD